MNAQELKKMFPNASDAFLAANEKTVQLLDRVDPYAVKKDPYEVAKNSGEISHPEPEHDKAPALGRAKKGKAKGVSRTLVRFVGYRVRPLDPDNFSGSVKDLLDGLRHAGLISGDEPWKIRLQTEQVRVSSFELERTEIEIAY